MWLIVYSNDHAPLTVRSIYSSSKLRTAQMMIFSLVAMIGLEKCCITSACLQWLCHSDYRTVARGPLVSYSEVVTPLYLSNHKRFFQETVQILRRVREFTEEKVNPTFSFAPAIFNGGACSITTVSTYVSPNHPLVHLLRNTNCFCWISFE